MGLMKPKWRIEKDKFSLIAGLPRWFWSRKVLLLLQSGVCFPDKGDIGVVLGALYCLFCGDVLRYELDNSLRTFSIRLEEWIGMLAYPRDTEKKRFHYKQESHTIPSVPHYAMNINFIQVCQGSLSKQQCWYEQEGLEHLYHLRAAYYSYPLFPRVHIQLSSIQVPVRDEWRAMVDDLQHTI